MCKHVKGEQEVLYVPKAGKSCPSEILDVLASMNAEGRPIGKPMHMQPRMERDEIFGCAA